MYSVILWQVIRAVIIGRFHRKLIHFKLCRREFYANRHLIVGIVPILKLEVFLRTPFQIGSL